jgi:hypothetical protein
MKPRSIALVIVLATLSPAITLSCSPDASKIVGTWINNDRQVLTLDKTLHGKLSQIARCGTPLAVRAYRDPYDLYAIQFDLNQLIYFPPRELQFFGGAEFFCADKDSVPMCNFCEIQGRSMICQTTEQKITGFGETVTHDCTWHQISVATTSTVISDFRLPGSCPAIQDAGGCNTPGLQPFDSGTGPDAAASLDGGRDAGPSG